MNSDQNPLKSKSYSFALEIIGTYEILITEKKEYILSKQLLRSGTAIGALVREAEYGQSKADFINKLSIGLKEANESLYWIELLKDSNYIEYINFIALEEKVVELIRLLTAIINTSKKNLTKK